MRKILLWLVIGALAAFPSHLARAQADATQQQIDKVSGQIQDLQEAQAEQAKHLAALEKQIADLSDKLNAPAASDNASADDLKKLATQVQELAKKQQADNDLILKEIEKLGKVSSTTTHKSPGVSTTTATSVSNTTATGPQKGYDYTIAAGDTVAAIAKAYRAQGVKVTTSQILAANPGLNPNSLIVGKKVFIPDPNAK